MIYHKSSGDVRDAKNLENLVAENTKLKDMLSYVALMSDIEIPEEGDNNVQAAEEDA